MLESSMVCGGIHKLGACELSETAKPLHWPSINNGPLRLVQANVSMDWVFDETPRLRHDHRNTPNLPILSFHRETREPTRFEASSIREQTFLRFIGSKLVVKYRQVPPKSA